MKNIVILGAGFAGLRTAIKLEKLLRKNQTDWRIFLIDKNSYHTYTPALYEAASAYRGKSRRKESAREFEEMVGSAVCLPIRAVLRKKRIEFIQDEVTGIDFDGAQVKTGAGSVLPFVYLVFAFGSASIYFNIKGAEQCCLDLKTLFDALRIRRRVEEEFVNAGLQGDIHITMVGGGFTGVETIAEIALYTKRLARDYGADGSRVRLSLLEAQDKILGQATAEQRRKAEERLKKLGVEIRTGTKISEVVPACLLLESGERCEAGVILWGGGVQGPAVLKNIAGLELAERGRIAVDAFLRAKGHENVFAAGDNALFVDEARGESAPPTAFVAEAQADIVAKNIVSSIRGESLSEYRLEIPGYVASCGGKYALAHVYGLSFAGFAGWLLKRYIDLKYFLSLLPPLRALRLWLRELRLFTKND